MKETIHYIKEADGGELNDLLMAVLARYRELYPNDEFHFFSVSKEDGETELARIVKYIKEHRDRKTYSCRILCHPERTQ